MSGSDPAAPTPATPADFRPLDPGRVESMDALEVRWWCHELGCDEPRLRRAMAVVGEHVTEIRDWLKTHP